MGGKRRLTSRGSSKQQSANYDRSGTLSCSSPRLRPILWAEVGLWSGATLDFEFLRDEVVRSNAPAFADFCRGEHRFRDRPEMLDEKLNHRAERPVFPGHDPDRRTSLATARRCKTGMFNARSRMAKLLKEPRSMEFKRMERTSAGSSLALALRARDARIL